jgi:WhiB family redox-sensing transcriptional regulator
VTAPRGDPAALPARAVSTGALEQRVHAGARCRGTDPDAFYPAVGTSGAEVTDTYARAERAHARALCAGCPVTAACLELALRIPAGLHGIWGATTERDRRAILRRRHADQRARSAGAVA